MARSATNRVTDGRNNLPPQSTKFVGRAAEAEAIRRLLAESRIVTLIGGPGIGKTRLALHVGAQMLADHIDGVWLIELAPLRDAASIPHVVAGTLGLTGTSHSDLEQIVAWLENKQMLLIIDNCEHVRDAACDFVALIARTCSGVRILATSQIALGLPVERTYAVAALAMPNGADEAKQSESLAAFDALALFADRARASDDRFVINSENIADVARICRYLEGVAVAIELTASRVQAANIKTIAADLRSAFGIDDDGGKTHAAARSMNWAIAQLDEHERRILMRLTVFAGGWTAASAEAVAADPFQDGPSMRTTLDSLVKRSLIVADPASAGRFHLIESIRDHLIGLQPAADDAMTAARHARHFAEFVAEADRRHFREPVGSVVVDVLPELDNIRAVIAWSLIEGNDVDLGCGIVGGLGYLWRIVSYHEGERLTTLALRAAADPASRVSDRTRAGLYRACAELDTRLHGAVLGLAKESIALYDSLGMAVMAAESRRIYGFRLYRHGRIDEAIVVLSEAAVTFALSGERRSEGRALSDLSAPIWSVGKKTLAISLHARAIEWATLASDRREASRIGLNFAECQFHTGDVDAAIRTATEALFQNGGVDHRENLSNNLAAYFLAQGNAVDAKRYALISLGLCRETSAPVTRALQHLAGVAALMGPETATVSLRLLGFVDKQLGVLKESRDRTEQFTYDQTMQHLASAVDEAGRAAELALGSRMTHDEAMALAASL